MRNTLLSGIYLCLFMLLAQIATAQCPASVPLSFNDIVTTESRCQASGTAEVQLTGGTAPFSYTITAGPATFPAQSANLFQSLPAGTYTLQVTDNCNTTISRNFTITGTYSVPQPTQQLVPPTCVGGTNGSITINITQGRSPYTYALIAPSPVVAAPQAGNQFNNLPAGSYTYQITDSCGNYQTRTVTLPDGNSGPYYISRGNLHYEACDSFSISYKIYPYDPAYIRVPFTFTLTLPNGSVQTHTISTYTTGNADNHIIDDTFHFRYHHVPGVTDQTTINGSNSCGYTTYVPIFLSELDMYPNKINSTNCSRDLSYAFEPGADNAPGATVIHHCSTVTYSLYSPAGALLTSQTNNSTFTGYPTGIHYKVVREDCCGKDSIYFDWEQRPAFKITWIDIDPGYACKEGSTNLSVGANRLTPGNLIIASGPPSITFGDGTVHNYVYPDTVFNLPFGSTSTNVNYFGAGTYKIYIVDTCGEKDSATFTITPAQLRHSTFAAQLAKGCVNDNKIIFNATSNGTTYDASIWVHSQSYSYNQYFYQQPYPFRDSAINLSADTYTALYAYQNAVAPWDYLDAMSGYTCDTIKTTVIVPIYTQPAFVQAPAIAVCGGNRSIALLADSTKGVSPYKYQIAAGSTTTSLQANNVFTGLNAGTYTFLMEDACGNSYSSSTAIDTLRVPAVALTGTACQGTSATLSLPANSYYTYSWQYPNGNTATGNTITVNPVTTADTGRYVVTVNSSINGCTDSESKALQVNFCSVTTLPLNLLHFSGSRQGNNVVLQWQTADEVNTSHFIVERSTDGAHFTGIQKVTAQGTATARYSATDYQAPAGKLYYRLQMADNNGKITYSPLVAVNKEGDNNLTVTPQLVTNNSNIKVAYTANTQATSIQVMGIDGRLWLTVPVAKGSTQTTIPTNALAKGNYLVIYIANNQRTAIQVVKL